MELTQPTQAKVSEYVEAWQEVRQNTIGFLEDHKNDFALRPDDGSWTIAENAEHIYLSQFFLARSIPIVLAGKFGQDFSGNPTADYGSLAGKFVRGAARNPEAVAPQGKWTCEEALLKLSEAMARFEKAVRGKERDALLRRGYEHPIQGPISLMEWIWMMIRHEHMHLQIMAEKFGTLSPDR
ncbi:MAG: DinB family protein [Spirochaetales bacterium]|nr:DinB family protein [Spirochaetales bacterium]